MNQPIKKKCWCGNAFGQCYQPIEEKWKEEFNKKFCSKTSEPKYSVWNAAALAYPEEIKSFIENLLEQDRERIRTFLKDSSVWDAEYIYHRKSLLLEKYDSFINPSRYH